MSASIAVLGATGLVGRTMLAVLEERGFPLDQLRLMASERSERREIEFRGRPHVVAAPSREAFEGVALALFACANAVSQEWARVATVAGARVVDNSSAFRYDDQVPLVVPEVNGALLERRPELVANPNCSVIALVVALAPLARVGSLERVVVSTYQAVSGAGSEALAELERGVQAGLAKDPPARGDGGPPFAFNVVPQIDRFEANGYSREEMKIVWEARKILGLPSLPLSATAVRVPVRIGHCAAVNVTFASPFDPDQARALWQQAPGVVVVDDVAHAEFPTPLRAAGGDAVLVGRIRRDVSHPNGLEFFIASDNLRKGAATNAVQIAEALLGTGGGSRTPGHPAAAR